MSIDLYSWIIRAIVLFTAMPIHEYSHGYVASRLGDDTARRQGRLTLNPLAHLDVFGSLLLIFTGFGWAKPVQIDPRNFRKPKRDMALTALAGPVSNILLATVIMAALRLVDSPGFRFIPRTVAYVLIQMISTNLYLAVFNLLPVPPLDGGKIFGIFLPDRIYFTIMRYERYIAAAVIILIFTGVLSNPLRHLATWLFSFLELITRPIAYLVN